MEKFGLWLIFSVKQPITELISTDGYFQNKIEKMKRQGLFRRQKIYSLFQRAYWSTDQSVMYYRPRAPDLHRVILKTLL